MADFLFVSGYPAEDAGRAVLDLHQVVHLEIDTGAHEIGELRVVLARRHAMRASGDEFAGVAGGQGLGVDGAARLRPPGAAAGAG